VAATPTVTAAVHGLASHEHDFDALRVTGGVTTELARRNTTVELRGELGRDLATDVGDPRFVGERTSGDATVALTQLVDPRTIIDVTVEGRAERGWHGSPYRRVWVADPAQPVATAWREATPRRLLALAAALRVRRAIGDRWFATAIGRGYVDDWEVHSATATVELRCRLDDRTLIGAAARGYLQDGAAFWRRHQPAGTAPPRYRTADRTLGPMGSAGLTVTASRDIDATGRSLAVAVGGLAWWFVDDAAQARRLAITTTVTWTEPL